jgi:glutamine amidotransferase-like uncharacterized protein
MDWKGLTILVALLVALTECSVTAGDRSGGSELPVAATLMTVSLVPYSNKGFSGVAPSGWMEKGPGEFYRGDSETDPTALVQQEVPGATADLVMELLAAKLGLDRFPDSTGGIKNSNLAWELFAVEREERDGNPTKLDIALAEHDGRVFFVLLCAMPDEHEELRYSIFLRAVDALTPTSAEATEKRPEQPTPVLKPHAAEVLLVKGEHLENDASDAVARLLQRELGLSTAFVDLDALGDTDFQDVKLVFFPGGDCASVSVRDRTARRVRDAVAAGTGYIGACCGAFLAAEGVTAASHLRLKGDGFGVFPGLAEWGGGDGTWPFHIDVDHPILANSSVSAEIAPVMRMRFVGGTSNLQPSYDEGLRNWRVATLENPAERTPGGTRAVMTATVFGRGRVFLTGAHPEAARATHSLLVAAAEWCTGGSEPKNGQPPLIVSEIPAEGVAGRFFAVSAVGSGDPHGYPVGFIWDFGDGAPKQYRPEAIHIYEKPGLYRITLTVTTGNRDATRTVAINIREP